MTIGADTHSVGVLPVWTTPLVPGHAGGVKPARTPAAALFRRVFLINGLIFTLGTLILALSPASVSSRIKLTEIPVLVVGLAIILTANALLLRSSLAPLDRLAASMRRVDPPKRSDRVDGRDSGDLQHLIESFNAMLDRLETERTTASASALAAQENERQRIARELHDEIGQTLTVALLTLKRAVDRAPASIHAELADAQEIVRAGLDEVRDIARRLRPGRSGGPRVAQRTQRAVQRLRPGIRHCRGQTHCAAIGPVEARRRAGVLPDRPGRADQCGAALWGAKVWVDLHTGEGELTLRVADDGCGGIATEPMREGAGINGMRERALLVNAALTISSPPGGGTEVRLVIPLRGA